MQNQKSNFAQIFLLEFTKQLIENSRPTGVIEIEQKEKIKESEEITHLENLAPRVYPEKSLKKIFTKGKKTPISKPQVPISELRHLTSKIQIPKQKIIPKKLPIRKLTIPEQKLPPRFQNIRPTPTKEEIDLEKLNPIITDPMAHSIECDGPNIPIKVITKTGQKRTTKIDLKKEEINKIINTFSTATRIPALEGVYKVAIGTLVLLSVISEVVGTKFVIRKIQPQRNLQIKKFPQRQMTRR